MLAACPSLVSAISAPIESSLASLFAEFNWQATDTLGNLLRLADTLEYYGLECLPSLTQGNLEEPRVFRKKMQEDLQNIIAQEIADGESAYLEFKSSLVFDRDKAQFKPDLPIKEYYSNEVLFSVLKTIAAFCNTGGGTLLIGVHDNGSAIGIEDDYQLLKKPEQMFDGWELLLRDSIEGSFLSGRSINSYVAVSRGALSGKTVCRIQVAPKSQLSFVKKANAVELYIRSGNRSVPIPFHEIERFFDLNKLFH